MHMSATWKTVRVFISSTFRDMQAERDHLVRFVFPRLREQLLPRRIHLVDVDLRWGVTSEQDASEVCREIITECRPRFLCILGGRYGTIPEGKELSITADEVHFGVLDADREGLFALFYLRHGAVTERMDASSPGFIREPRHSEKAAKLARLKRGIRRAKCKPVLYRPRWKEDEQRLVDLKAFGDRVEQDILATIDDEFGAEPPAQRDEFGEESAAMEAFVEERSQRFVLGSREAVLEELLAHASATSGNGYLCLTGAPGSGKSALLAHLSQHLTLKNQPSTILIRHFVGASPGSTDVRRTLRRLCHKLKAGGPDITADIPDDPEKLRAAFPDFLRQACARWRVVILIDAVNQFDPAPHSAGLHWLPEELPSNARVILSAIDGPALEECRRRPHKPHEIELQPLTAADAEAIIEQFHKRYRKQFEPEQRAALLAKTDAGTPLYLLAALEELRTLGTYEGISQRIAELPITTHELFGWILKRLEDDSGFHDAAGRRVGHELVSRFAALLGASRHGLSQRELTDLLDPGDPQGNVAALLHLMRPYLMRHGELLDFYHGQLKEAIGEYYLGDEDERTKYHRTIADYFEHREQSHRRDDELPWQLAEAQCWERLRDCLSNLEMLVRLLAGGRRFEVLTYWRKMTDQYDMATEYARAAQAYEYCGAPAEALVEHIGAAAELLWTGAEHSGAERLLWHVLEAEKVIVGPRHPRVADRLFELARLLLATNQLQEAERLLREALVIQEAAFGANSPRITSVLNQLANCLLRSNWSHEAEALVRRALVIDTQAHGADNLDVAVDLCNLARMVEARGQHPEAESMYRQALKIEENKRGPGHPDVAVTLNNLGVLLRKRGRTAEAETMLRRALEIDEKAFGPNHPDTGRDLGNLAVLLGQEDRSAEAEAMLRRTLDIDERTYGFDHPDVAVDLHNLASHLFRTDRQAEAEVLWCRSLEIMASTRGEGHPTTLQIKTALREMKTQQIGTEQERRAAAIDSQLRLVRGLQMRGDLGGVMAASQRLERLCKVAGDWSGVQNSIGFQSEALCNMGDFDGALAMDRERERLCRDHGHAEGLIISLANQAHLLASQFDRAYEALPLTEESYQLAMQHGLNDLAQQAKEVVHFVCSKLGTTPK